MPMEENTVPSEAVAVPTHPKLAWKKNQREFKEDPARLCDAAPSQRLSSQQQLPNKFILSDGNFQSISKQKTLNAQPPSLNLQPGKENNGIKYIPITPSADLSGRVKLTQVSNLSQREPHVKSVLSYRF